MANATQCILWVLRQEDSLLAGKVVVLADGAGMTRFGIAQNAHPEVPPTFYTEPAITALNDAIAIYKAQYWNPLCGDQINYEPLAASLLSFAINDGERFDEKMFQGILGVVEDGVCGPATLAAANAKDGPTLLGLLQNAQWAHYQATAIAKPEEAIYLPGWRTRAFRTYPSLA